MLVATLIKGTFSKFCIGKAIVWLSYVELVLPYSVFVFLKRVECVHSVHYLYFLYTTSRLQTVERTLREHGKSLQK